MATNEAESAKDDPRDVTQHLRVTQQELDEAADTTRTLDLLEKGCRMGGNHEVADLIAGAADSLRALAGARVSGDPDRIAVPEGSVVVSPYDFGRVADLYDLLRGLSRRDGGELPGKSKAAAMLGTLESVMQALRRGPVAGEREALRWPMPHSGHVGALRGLLVTLDAEGGENDGRDHRGTLNLMDHNVGRAREALRDVLRFLPERPYEELDPAASGDHAGGLVPPVYHLYRWPECSRYFEVDVARKRAQAAGAMVLVQVRRGAHPLPTPVFEAADRVEEVVGDDGTIRVLKDRRGKLL